MSTRSHEIPTHLNVEDKLLFGLTVRQFLYVLVGCSIAYGWWDQAVALGTLVRGGLVAFVLLTTAAVTLARPFGRPLEEWLIAATIYFSTPRRATWRQPPPHAASWRPAEHAWQELAPSLLWAEDEPT